MLTPAKTRQDHRNKKRIAELRKTLGLSREDFGKKIGRQERMVRYYENGGQFVPPEVERLIGYMEREVEVV